MAAIGQTIDRYPRLTSGVLLGIIAFFALACAFKRSPL